MSKRRSRSPWPFATFLLLGYLWFAIAASGQAPSQMVSFSYQGRLFPGSSAEPFSGTVWLQFSLQDAPFGELPATEALWQGDPQATEVLEGFFTASVGPVPAELFSGDRALMLHVGIAAYSDSTPPEVFEPFGEPLRILPVPAAAFAHIASYAATSGSASAADSLSESGLASLRLGVPPAGDPTTIWAEIDALQSAVGTPPDGSGPDLWSEFSRLANDKADKSQLSGFVTMPQVEAKIDDKLANFEAGVSDQLQAISNALESLFAQNFASLVPELLVDEAVIIPANGTMSHRVRFLYATHLTWADGYREVRPSGLDLNPQTGLITWTPSAAMVGLHELQLQARNPFMAAGESSTTATLRVIVLPPNMGYVPAGSFWMGNPNYGSDLSVMFHRVTLSQAFFMDQFEVSRNLWNEVVESVTDSPYVFTRTFLASDWPASGISWNEAIVWCNKRSEKEGLQPVYRGPGGQVIRNAILDPFPAVTADWTANGYRLPTEAEWEYAARGGDNLVLFPWGDAPPSSFYLYRGSSFANVDADYPPTAFGIYQMAGNVGEWVFDLFDAAFYEQSAVDPRNTVSGTQRVVRGGNRSQSTPDFYVFSRRSLDPANTGLSNGFRTVRNVFLVPTPLSEPH